MLGELRKIHAEPFGCAGGRLVCSTEQRLPPQQRQPADIIVQACKRSPAQCSCLCCGNRSDHRRPVSSLVGAALQLCSPACAVLALTPALAAALPASAPAAG